jgi:hypothetical protein
MSRGCSRFIVDTGSTVCSGRQGHREGRLFIDSCLHAEDGCQTGFRKA